MSKYVNFKQTEKFSVKYNNKDCVFAKWADHSDQRLEFRHAALVYAKDRKSHLMQEFKKDKKIAFRVQDYPHHFTRWNVEDVVHGSGRILKGEREGGFYYNLRCHCKSCRELPAEDRTTATNVHQIHLIAI